ncbi:MAG: DUF2975 domain-containing protein [Candidatus Mcinerneyibacterium aminivorans]|jgi:hypothetical protein|uniref:DUF2975 domain-containing protein n=1 Tax=Candidatus Mcinerneyibacterium aminivorans TaxID=2703815 RepID=A0A5D0MH41_9BACT|nr:MAG: DUF2975 domain-containing protein [Candidatus Mcinerneyibacterium aminivorans]
MKREVLFLKAAVVFIGILVLALCIFMLPLIAKDAAKSSWKMAYTLYGILAIMYVSVIPFFAALYHSFRILIYIDTNKAFSELSVKALGNLKKYATIIIILYLIGMPLFYIVGEVDDAPGVILIGMIFVFAPMAVAVFANLLKKLLKNAIDIKNDMR